MLITKLSERREVLMDLICTGFMLGERYHLIRPVTASGESVVYYGKDTYTGGKVLIHEYLPANLAYKSEDSGEVVCKAGNEVMYKSLMEDFIELGRLLCSLCKDERYAIVRCLDCIRQNNTVYMVFEDPQSATFEDFLAKLNGSIGWLTLKRMLSPVVNALSALHLRGYCHRGISPSTLMLTPNQTLKLTDFCIPAARTAQSEITSSLFFGYAAPEQYTISSWQGPWTDIYSLAATCYRALTGVSVVDARQRRTQPKLVSPIEYNKDIPQYVSDAIMKALSIDPQRRHSSVEEFWRELTDDIGTTMAFAGIKPQEDHPPPIIRKSAPDWALPVFLTLFVISAATLAYNSIVNPEYFIHATTSGDASSEPQSSDPAPVIRETVPSFVDKYIETVLGNEKYTDKFAFVLEWTYSEQYPYGTIISQMPSVETPIEGQEVRLVVSKGSEYTTMPNLIGQEEHIAVEMLTALGIRYEVMPIIDIESPAYTILSADREFGEQLSKERDVVYLYSVRHS